MASNCFDESWVWIDDWHCWQTRNSFLNLIIIVVAAVGLLGVKPFSFHFISSHSSHSSLCFENIQIQIHLLPPPTVRSQDACTIITVSFRLMSIIFSVYPSNVSTNRTLESRNKSNHLLIENGVVRQATTNNTSVKKKASNKKWKKNLKVMWIMYALIAWKFKLKYFK